MESTNSMSQEIGPVTPCHWSSHLPRIVHHQFDEPRLCLHHKKFLFEAIIPSSPSQSRPPPPQFAPRPLKTYCVSNIRIFLIEHFVRLCSAHQHFLMIFCDYFSIFEIYFFPSHGDRLTSGTRPDNIPHIYIRTT